VNSELPAPPISRRPVKILLVDDRQENLHALESLLKSDQIEIHKAASGRDALELLLNHEFAVALLDVQMPEINGFELAELMRGSDQTKKIPIIFVTARAIDPQDTFLGYEAGAVDFLFKPLDPRIVRNKVQVFLQLEEQRLLIQSQIQQLEAALRVREEFLSIASHELKTPLATLSFQLQVTARQVDVRKGTAPSPEKLTQIFESANRQVMKLTNMIDDLLDISRIQAGKLSISVSPVDLSPLISEVVERLSQQLEQAGCTVRLDIEKSLIVPCEAVRVEQVLVNLISNVIKYAAGSVMTVTLRHDLQYAQLSVCDQGPGIPEEKLGAVFERFERLGLDKNVSGLGLGLYIVKQIMKAHDGDITIQSRPGEGTVFEARFPLLADRGF
jgi:signal transduction histidine kinase